MPSLRDSASCHQPCAPWLNAGLPDSSARRWIYLFYSSLLANFAGSAALLIGKLKLRASAQSPPGDGAQVVMIIADGVRPDALARFIDGGHLPALAAIREEGQLSTITSAFPSVTGPAYAPFLMGRYPGSVGLPGLRWFDRTRRVAKLTGYARSYVGADMRLVDRDIAAASESDRARRSLPARQRHIFAVTYAAGSQSTAWSGKKRHSVSGSKRRSLPSSL